MRSLGSGRLPVFLVWSLLRSLRDKLLSSHFLWFHVKDRFCGLLLKNLPEIHRSVPVAVHLTHALLLLLYWTLQDSGNNILSQHEEFLLFPCCLLYFLKSLDLSMPFPMRSSHGLIKLQEVLLSPHNAYWNIHQASLVHALSQCIAQCIFSLFVQLFPALEVRFLMPGSLLIHNSLWSTQLTRSYLTPHQHDPSQSLRFLWLYSHHSQLSVKGWLHIPSVPY